MVATVAIIDIRMGVLVCAAVVIVAVAVVAIISLTVAAASVAVAVVAVCVVIVVITMIIVMVIMVVVVIVIMIVAKSAMIVMMVIAMIIIMIVMVRTVGIVVTVVVAVMIAEVRRMTLYPVRRRMIDVAWRVPIAVGYPRRVPYDGVARTHKYRVKQYRRCRNGDYGGCRRRDIYVVVIGGDSHPRTMEPLDPHLVRIINVVLHVIHVATVNLGVGGYRGNHRHYDE